MDLKCCTLCPRQCGVNRTEPGARGFCGAGQEMEVAKIMHHHWEEPCISGDPLTGHGSGAIFFAHCSLGCVYCQNKKISRTTGTGRSMSSEELAQAMLTLQSEGVYNVNLVSPTHYTPLLVEAVALAKEGLDGEKLHIPVVWNTGGYERPEVIEKLKGTADVFLTDFKYADPLLATRYSHAEDYPRYAAASLAKMVEVTGDCAFDENGMMQKGVIVRHLVLPGHWRESVEVLRTVADIVDPASVRLSLMAQYTPEFLPPPAESAEKDPYGSIRRRITTYEYEKVAAEARRLGFDGYMQDRSSATKNFTPDF